MPRCRPSAHSCLAHLHLHSQLDITFSEFKSTFRRSSVDPIPLSGRNINGFNLARCTGDCDSDTDCLGGLKCFQRSYGDPIPGCTGNGADDDWDYCYGMPPQSCAACLHPLRVGGSRCSRTSYRNAPHALRELHADAPGAVRALTSIIHAETTSGLELQQMTAARMTATTSS